VNDGTVSIVREHESSRSMTTDRCTSRSRDITRHEAWRRDAQRRRGSVGIDRSRAIRRSDGGPRSHTLLHRADCGLPSRPQREVVPDPARLERAATLTTCGLDAPLSGGCAWAGSLPKLLIRPIRTKRVSANLSVPKVMLVVREHRAHASLVMSTGRARRGAGCVKPRLQRAGATSGCLGG